MNSLTNVNFLRKNTLKQLFPPKHKILPSTNPTVHAPDLPVYSFRKSFRAPRTHTHTLVRCKQASRLNTTNTFFLPLSVSNLRWLWVVLFSRLQFLLWELTIYRRTHTHACENRLREAADAIRNTTGQQHQLQCLACMYRQERRPP